MGNKSERNRRKLSMKAFRKRQSRHANLVKTQKARERLVTTTGTCEPSTRNTCDSIAEPCNQPTSSANTNSDMQEGVANAIASCSFQNETDDGCFFIEPERPTSCANTNSDMQEGITNATASCSFQNEPKDCFSIEPERDEENIINIGRRIINVSQFFSELKDVASHGPLNCNLDSMELVSEKRTGLLSQFKLKCKMCNKKFFINNDNPVQELDVNTSAVAGTIAIGCGYSQLTELSAAIGLAPMSKKIFTSKMEIVHKKWESELLKSMAEAAEEERKLAIEDGKVHSSGIPIIDVIADGCYGKRSYKKNYSSLSGAAAIIGKKTNKILYLSIKNKYCCICSQAQSKNMEVKEHVCYKNYTGASTGMESDILVEGFKKKHRDAQSDIWETDIRWRC